MRLLRAALVLAIFGWSCPAVAHPHIFVRYGVRVEQKNEEAPTLHFTFKVHQSATPFFSPGDTQILDRDMAANLERHPFYLYLDLDGEALGRQAVHLSAAGTAGEDKIYTYDLTLPNHLNNFGFALYDPEYFDSVVLDDPQGFAMHVNQLNCGVQTQTVEKTIWGVLQAQYVRCGEPSVHKPAIQNIARRPPEEFNRNDDGLSQRGIVP